MAAYLYILQVQGKGIEFSPRMIADYLSTGPLRNRNDASIRYRMRNISHVLRERGQTTIPIYSPAPRVGSNVRARIELILNKFAGQGLSEISSTEGVPSLSLMQTISLDGTRSEATEKLESLKTAIDDLSVEVRRLSLGHQIAGIGNTPDPIDKLASVEVEGPLLGHEISEIGHNNPPEPIDDPSFSADEVERLSELVQELKQEIDGETPDPSSIETKRNQLLYLGLTTWSWLGGRLTTFTDAALKMLAPILVAKITGVLPQLIDAVEAVGRFLETMIK